MTVTKLEPIEFSADNMKEDLAICTINNVSDAVVFTDKYHRIIYANKQFEMITGFLFEEVKGDTPKALQTKIMQLGFYDKTFENAMNELWQGEVWNRQDSHKIYTQSVSMQARKDKAGNVVHYISVFTDLMEYGAINETEIQHNVYYDALTSMPNRLFFEKLMVASVKKWKQSEKSVAAAFLQLENFSAINEKYGLLFGDVILQRTAARLYRFDMIVTRWNGTKFACVFESLENRADATEKITQILSKIAEPIMVNGIEIKLQLKCGLHMYEHESDTVADFLSDAHTALETAKKEQIDMLFYEKQMGRAEKFFMMEMELKRAIHEDQFELFYQPFISMDTEALAGFEGLIRWKHPTGGMISPIEFIPFAEQTGLIEAIGMMVFEKACKQSVEWREKGYEYLKIYVNLSMNQFKDNLLVERMQNILQLTGANPSNIGVELTESAITVDVEETILKLNELRNLGLSIAIDDFGTGYASFGYLIDFPVDRIKVDRSYIKAMDTNKKIHAIVSAIIHMGENLNIEVVAEGIETNAQLKQAAQLNFNIIQGYLYDRPLTKIDAEARWLQL